jgi:GntR family transcriptional repressor for pyruvate dehydrogenase complex
MAVENKKKLSVVDSVVEAMLKAIEDGRFVPGKKIPTERALTKEFGVSRTALREAFQKLEQLGKLTIRQGDGTYLNPPEISQKISLALALNNVSISQYIEVRELLEFMAIPLIIERASTEELDNLTSILKDQEENISNDQAFAQLDIDFHHALMAMTKNTVLQQCWSVTSPALSEQMKRICAVHGMKQRAFRHHQKLLDHIANGECQKAQAQIRQHFASIPSDLYLWG